MQLGPRLRGRIAGIAGKRPWAAPVQAAEPHIPLFYCHSQVATELVESRVDDTVGYNDVDGDGRISHEELFDVSTPGMNPNPTYHEEELTWQHNNTEVGIPTVSSVVALHWRA